MHEYCCSGLCWSAFFFLLKSFSSQSNTVQMSGFRCLRICPWSAQMKIFLGKLCFPFYLSSFLPLILSCPSADVKDKESQLVCDDGQHTVSLCHFCDRLSRCKSATEERSHPPLPITHSSAYLPTTAVFPPVQLPDVCFLSSHITRPHHITLQ